LDIEKRFFS